MHWSTRLALVGLFPALHGCGWLFGPGDEEEPTATSPAPPPTPTSDTTTSSPPPTTPEPTTPPEPVVDAFTVGGTAATAVDVLFVVDNSCSAGDEQDLLAAGFETFIAPLDAAGLDYHVGVTSTDIDYAANGTQGKLRSVGGEKYIDTATVDPAQLFADLVSMGVNGSGSEKGMGAAYLAIDDASGANGGFYREDAALHTIVVTDEPDFTTAALVTEAEFVAWYDALKLDPSGRTFSTVCMPGECATYSALAGDLDGDVYDVGDSWSVTLSSLGDLASSPYVALLTDTFTLTQVPDPRTLEVSVILPDGTLVLLDAAVLESGEWVGDWTYNVIENSVTLLTDAATLDSTVVIEYLPE